MMMHTVASKRKASLRNLDGSLSRLVKRVNFVHKALQVSYIHTSEG